MFHLEELTSTDTTLRSETRVSRAFPLRAGCFMEIQVSEQQVVRRNIVFSYARIH